MESAIPFNNKKSFVDRGFSSQAPKHLNSLPIELKTCSLLDKSLKNLKRFLFRDHYHGTLFYNYILTFLMCA